MNEEWKQKRLVVELALRLVPMSMLASKINLPTNEFTGHLTSASFLCWYAGLDDPRIRKELTRTLSSCTYPIPSLDLASKDFDGMRYWRGPTWAILNALIGIGLADQGYEVEAKKLRLLTRELIASHGFAEYFHPETGAPAGGGAFTWTSAVWLAWASPSAGEN